MLAHQSRRGRRRGWPSGVAGARIVRPCCDERAFEVGLRIGPGPHVVGLLLAPDEIRLPEAAKLLDQRLMWPRIELLDAQEINIVDAAPFALLVKIVVDLARAQ